MGRVFERNGNYYIDFYKGKERIRKKIGPYRRKALLALKKMEGKTADEIYDLLEVKKNPKFSCFAKEYLAWSRSNKKSWKRDELSLKHLTAFFGDKRLRDINQKNVESYKSHRQEDPRSPKGPTINRELACLKHLFNLAIQYNEATENPVKVVKYFKENTTAWQYLKPEEAERLVDACPEYFRPIVIIALNTGMRKNEILGLRWFDVDFQLPQITVRETKSGEPRYIPMNSTLTEILGKVRLRCKTEYVFTKRDGSPYKDIRKPFEKALREARVGRIRFHDLRHTFASQLVMMGVDLMTVKELLGHKTIQMTMRYAHLSQDHKKMAVERLGSRPEIGPETNTDKKQALQYS